MYSQKPGTPSSLPSKSLISEWIKQICPDTSNRFRVEDLGNGVIYCRLLNHYFPNSISAGRINLSPKNQYEYGLNLKQVQNVLTQYKLNIPLDVGKVSKCKFQENWGLINNLYRHLVLNAEENLPNNAELSHVQSGEQSKQLSSFGGVGKNTPKRSFQTAFGSSQIKGSQQIEHPSTQPNFRQPFVYQNSYPLMQQQPMFQHNSFVPEKYFAENPLIQAVPYSNVHKMYGLRATETPQHLGKPMGQESQKNNLFKAPIKNDSNQRKYFSVGRMLPESNHHSEIEMKRQGKLSANSMQMFRKNNQAMIDRIKEILLKAAHDLEKIRQIKIILNIPITDDIVKIEEQDTYPTYVLKTQKPNQPKSSGLGAQKQTSKQLVKQKQIEVAETKEQISENSIKNSSQQVPLENCKENEVANQSQESVKVEDKDKNSQSLSNISGASGKCNSSSISSSSRKMQSRFLNPTFSSEKKVRCVGIDGNPLRR